MRILKLIKWSTVYLTLICPNRYLTVLALFILFNAPGLSSKLHLQSGQLVCFCCLVEFAGPLCLDSFLLQLMCSTLKCISLSSETTRVEVLQITLKLVSSICKCVYPLHVFFLNFNKYAMVKSSMFVFTLYQKQEEKQYVCENSSCLAK